MNSKSSKNSDLSIVASLCNIYENTIFMPLFATCLQMTGLGAIDRLISKRGSDIALEKIKNLIEELDKKIDIKEGKGQEDNFIAGLNITLKSIFDSPSTEKINYFSKILSDMWNREDVQWNETFQALKIIRDLEDVHISVLNEVSKIKASRKIDDRPFFVVDKDLNKQYAHPNLANLMQHLKPFELKLYISDLISKGLLNDIEVDRSGTNAITLFSISDAGRWFLDKINTLEPSST